MNHMQDRYAFEFMYNYYKGILGSFVSSDVHSYMPMYQYEDDIFQEASTVLVTAIDTYRNDQQTHFSTYYTILARRRVWNILRSISRKYGRFREMISLDESMGQEESLYEIIPQRDPMNDPEFILHYGMAADQLKKALGSMSEDEVDAAAAWITNEPYQEGAEKRGLSYKAWDGRRTRVRRKIRDAVYGR